MDCLTYSLNEAQTLLDYCSGALEPAAAAEVTRHVESCDECRRVVNAQRELWESLGQWTAPAVSQDFNRRLYARITLEKQDSGWRQWIRRMTRPALPYALWKPAALAAACAVLVVGFLVHEPRVADNGVQIETQQHVDIEQVANALEELDLLTPSGSSSAM